MTNAITYSLSGRLGNHLQLLACARVLALRYGWHFVYRPILHEDHFALSQRFPRSFADSVDRFLVERVLALSYKVNPLDSRRHRLMQALLHPLRRIVYLDDSSWDATNGMLGELTPTCQQIQHTLFVLRFNGIFRNLGKERTRVVEDILPSPYARSIPMPQSEVGIHIRRDDTEYGLPMLYYVNAVRTAQQALAQPLRLHLFSDGAHELLANELMQNLTDTTMQIHQKDAVSDIMALACYPTLILSASWFSYWAAMFSQAITIFAPPGFCYYPEWKPVGY